MTRPTASASMACRCPPRARRGRGAAARPTRAAPSVARWSAHGRWRSSSARAARGSACQRSLPCGWEVNWSTPGACTSYKRRISGWALAALVMPLLGHDRGGGRLLACRADTRQLPQRHLEHVRLLVHGAVQGFRYHLVSIVAVFLALAIGIVLGSTELQGLPGRAAQDFELAHEQAERGEAQRNSYAQQAGTSDAFLKRPSPSCAGRHAHRGPDRPGHRAGIAVVRGQRRQGGGGVAGAAITGTVALDPGSTTCPAPPRPASAINAQLATSVIAAHPAIGRPATSRTPRS